MASMSPSRSPRREPTGLNTSSSNDDEAFWASPTAVRPSRTALRNNLGLLAKPT
jgi:hypothetical protein